MTRRKRLERILDERFAPVRDDLAELAGQVRVYHHDATVVGTAKVANAEQRVTAATAQAAERARFDADTLAGLRAELAEARGETVRAAHLALAEECRSWQRDAVTAFAQRDEARGQVAHLEAEVERLTIERDEARRQHDEQRRVAQEWMAEWQADGPALDHLNALAAAACAVLPDLAHGLASQPRGGSRTRARKRMEALAALVTPGDNQDTTDNPQEAA